MAERLVQAREERTMDLKAQAMYTGPLDRMKVDEVRATSEAQDEQVVMSTEQEEESLRVGREESYKIWRERHGRSYEEHMRYMISKGKLRIGETREGEVSLESGDVLSY